MTSTPRAPVSVLVAIGLTSAVLLAYQIAATRILSATTSYEVSFAIIALVMLGLAASGTRLYVDRKKKPDDTARTSRALIRGAASIVVGMVLVVGAGHAPLEPLPQIRLATFVAAAAFYPPFFFTGYAIASILTDYAEDIGRVYWADLVGAALGCFAFVPVTSVLTPIQLSLWCAVALSGAALLMARETGTPSRSSLVALGTTAMIAIIAVVAVSTTQIGRSKFANRAPIWWSWNHLSMVTAYDELGPTQRPLSEEEAREFAQRAGIGWGVSEEWDGPIPQTRRILLDNNAATTTLKGGADADLTILSWDVTALGHHAKGDELENVFIIGGGGGRDILTALSFGARSVDVVELNPAVVHYVQDVMPDYSNRPYTAPGVKYEIGDARSELSRRDTRYDLIQMSMVDTFASSSSGALALTENVLYTREAFDIYREHLTSDGILSITRWYDKTTYGDLARLLSLVGDSLQRGGIDNPDAHVVVVYTRWRGPAFVSTVLMKTSAFTPEELARIGRARDEMGFTQLWPARPDVEAEIDVPNLLRGIAPESDAGWLELDPPTDDFPFFFNFYRPVMSYVTAITHGTWDRVSRATSILLGLLVIALLWSWLVVTRPLRRESDEGLMFGRGPRVYFACVGLGFLSVEIALIQRLTIFLGHPSYALSVVLSALLFFGGIGSFLSERLTSRELVRRGAIAVIVMITLYAFALPLVFVAAEPWSLAARLVLAVACLAPISVSLGLMYPSGIRLLTNVGRADTVPWAWAINGVWGVLASVLGMLVAMTFGYRALLFVAVASYAIAWFALSKFDETDHGAG